ncbi:helix-turn-helix transcriptional regulator [Haliscomenobacter hydrossis]|uniref:Helix-turn-helix domain protein n=1 Tax=Haliscomenobacter hydrossis (strain ATCC 27775 / DSM 1100 / LMG 10767 / O) TaxID=760192 RepID=F4L1W8_HALH1|nr:helix-turn-helix transcriptional regulator [Haliscomenobacter hydrossis]AEE50601.1 helix-turn-helix domain protein [Haliscomenobacter hydrossis DSM 1100]
MDAIQNTKEKDTTWLEDAKWRQANAEWLDLSAAIAIKILRYLREHKTTQKELADRLGFSPQYVNKIVKGSENLTLETICKIQKALGIIIIEVPGFMHKDELEPELPLSDNYTL